MAQTDTRMEYTNSEWLEDYEFLQSLCESGKSAGVIKAETSNHFAARYHDEYMTRFARFFEAMRYLEQNLESFNFGKAGVIAEEEALVSNAVLLGLRDYFCSLPLDKVVDQPDATEIMRLVHNRLLEG